jgi:arabinose-5-phosphate isomerase
VLQTEATRFSRSSIVSTNDSRERSTSSSTAAGAVIVTGMGKSGHHLPQDRRDVSSTGTAGLLPSPRREAIHGDLGVLQADDVILALSNSGETEELLRPAGDDQAAWRAHDRDDW